MQVETFELADLAKTRTTELCDDSDDCTRGEKVALAWVADMLQDGWEIWNPDQPTYYRMRLASMVEQYEDENTGVLGWGFDGEEWVFGWHKGTVLEGLYRMAGPDYFSALELADMLEALEFGNTVPFRKWMRKI